MQKQHLNKLKKNYEEDIKINTVERGGMFTHIALFGSVKDTKQPGIVQVFVDNEYMESIEAKEKFATERVPQIAEEIKKTFIIESAVWTSEAWLRSTSNDELESVDNNWQKLPIKMEVLFMSFHNSDLTVNIKVYQIIRNGKKVTDGGDLIDNIELKELSELNSNKNNDTDGRINDILSQFF